MRALLPDDHELFPVRLALLTKEILPDIERRTQI